jgi:hypothetical protein
MERITWHSRAALLTFYCHANKEIWHAEATNMKAMLLFKASIYPAISCLRKWMESKFRLPGKAGATASANAAADSD